MQVGRRCDKEKEKNKVGGGECLREKWYLGSKRKVHFYKIKKKKVVFKLFESHLSSIYLKLHF